MPGSPVLGFVIVRGVSMEPTLHDGDRLLVSYRRTPRPGDIAIVKLPKRPIGIKRLSRRVGNGWWLERDNPDAGVDSWAIGAVSDDAVIAIATMRVWPRPRLL